SGVPPLEPLPILETAPQGTDLIPTPDTVEAPANTDDSPWYKQVGAHIGAFVTKVTSWPANVSLPSTGHKPQQAPYTPVPAYRGPRPDPPNLRPRSTKQTHSLSARIGETAMVVAGCGWYLAEALAATTRIHKAPASASNIKVAPA